MKNVFILVLSAAGLLASIPLFAQQQPVASGSEVSNATGTFSYSIGQINYAQVSNTFGGVQEGLQQTISIHLLHVKAFLQGYYLGSGVMNDVLYNQGEYTSPSMIADSITIELHQANAPYTLAHATKAVISQQGDVLCSGFGILGQSYYIVLKHRNSIEIWCSSPVTLTPSTTYDFSLTSAQAYGGNQYEVEPGVWAIYSGDINQDLVVDAFDYLILDPEVVAGTSGYVDADLTGDGIVDAFDYILLDANLVNGIGAVTP